ncbi:MAG TPA: NAD(P)/FAD-dependent oxidoreductase [Euzebyales bacterium]|nr:NAD(P)/FAD-dependent oxidoreductase [Euzebyales bacterium]
MILFTPAQYDGLPGMPFPAGADTYPGKDEVAAYLETYAAAFDLPVRLGARVTQVSRDGDRYVVATAAGTVSAGQVVVATGPFQTPVIPSVAAGLDPAVVQLHSAYYRNPGVLPQGTVLVVGSGNSGCQIAAELAATHPVALAVGQRLPSFPQRLAGRDLFWWLTITGAMRATAESRLGRRMRARDAVIGTGPRQLQRLGVRLRPRVTAATGRTIGFADGGRLDGVATVIWATGYHLDHSWIHVPEATDDAGAIVQRRGVTPVPGLYTLGLPWQHTRGSALLGFVTGDAAYLAARIAERHARAGRTTPSPTG